MTRTSLFIIAVLTFPFFSGCVLSAAKKKPVATRPLGFLIEDNHQDWVRQSGRYQVEMKMTPVRPRAKEGAVIEFIVTDISTQSSKPVSEAVMACTARMPNVSGHIHVMETHLHHPEVAPGHYEMHPLSFQMGGRWDVLLQLKAPDGYEFYAVFPLNVVGPPWPKTHVPKKDLKALSQQESIKRRLGVSKKNPPLDTTPLPVGGTPSIRGKERW